MRVDMNTEILSRRRITATAPATAVCIRIEALSLDMGGRRLLDDISIDVDAGSVVLLRGPNGAGKTTLLNLLSGLVSPTAGSLSVKLGGSWVAPSGVALDRLGRLGLGRLWQDIRPFSTMTVLENVLAATPELPDASLFGALTRPRARRRAEVEARARAWLACVGMADRAGSTCERLSVGQMKRVALARLFQQEATVLLLDEPLAGLERDSCPTMINLICRLCRAEGKTALIVEHRHDEVAPSADRVLTLAEGRLTEEPR